MKNKKIVTIVAGVIIIGLVFGFVVYQGKANANKAGIPVFTETVSKEDLTTSIFTNGTVISGDKRTITPETQGKILEIFVKEGDYVESGTLLVKLDGTDLESTIKSQEIALKIEKENLKDLKSGNITKFDIPYKNAEMALTEAKKAYEDKKELYAAGAVSSAELDAAKIQYDRANNDFITAKRNLNGTNNASQITVQTLRIDQAQSSLSKLYSDLKKTKIYAPISGTITSLPVKLGDMASMAAPIAVIEDTKNLKVETNVNVYDIYKVAPGQTVQIKAEGSNLNYSGKVLKIAPAAFTSVSGQSTETVVKTEIGIMDQKTQLKPNYPVKLTINTASSTDALSLPYEAVYVKKDGKKVAFLVGEDKKAKEVVLKVGIEGDMFIQILNTDLKVGDQVILNPTEDLVDGTLVKVSEAKK